MSPDALRTLRALCDWIVPADGRSGSAGDAGVPELLAYLAGESREYRRKLTGGLIWLDAWCSVTHGAPFLACDADTQAAIVQRLAYRRHGERDPALRPGILFFAFLRRETLSGFFTSRIGIADLDYRGNQVLSTFEACPEIPELQGVTTPAASEARPPSGMLEPCEP